MGKKDKGSNLKNWVPLNGQGAIDGLVREQNTGREGERRTYVLDPFYDPKNEEYIYKYRGQTKAPLVGAYGSELFKQPKVKGDAKDKKAEKEKAKNVYMSAITEHIPKRLADVGQLTFGESLYTLDRSLEGYEAAYDKCGPMYINDRMIGYTPEGYAKVWVNEDFANNHPAYPRKTLESTLEDSTSFLEGKQRNPLTGHDEADMVENVIDVVANHCEQGRYPEPFRSQIHQKGYNFREARRFIKQYALENHVFVPDRVDIWNHRCWDWRKTTTIIDNTYIPPPRPMPEPVVYRPPVERTHGYRFNYIPPEQPYHPDIFASRMGDHGVYHGHHY